MLISGSRPLPDAVTRSIGTGALLSGSAERRASTRPLTASTRAGLDGPWLDPPDAVALFGPGEVADGRLQKCFGSLKLCPISSEPTALPSRSTMLPPAWNGIATLATPLTSSG